MAKPDFLCIGAQKGGTTWLDKMFRSHEGIWTPPVKELQYFNELYMPNAFKWTKRHREQHGAKAIGFAVSSSPVDWKKVELGCHIARGKISLEWYEKIFDFAPVNTVKGEMTPEYSLLLDKYVKLIAQDYPELKIIFVMRDPVERALSGIRMRLQQQGFDENSLQEDIDNFVTNAAADWDVIERSNYERIINLWLNAFSKKNILLLLSDDLKNKPDKALQKVSEFLNVPVDGFKANSTERVHVGKSFSIGKTAIEAVIAKQEANLAWFENYVLGVE